jgi:dipeptidyl aminopeptidase/acylaminoacyl peptidase
MNVKTTGLVLALTAASCTSLPPTVVPRSELFSQNSYRSRPLLSPDGAKLAWIDCPYHRPCRLMMRNMKSGETHNSGTPGEQFYSGFNSFRWRSDSQHLLYWHSKKEDENNHLMEFDPDKNEIRDLTPFQNSHALFLGQSKDRIAYAANNRDPKFFDVYQVRVKAGTITRIYDNPGDVVDWQVDDNQNVSAVIQREGLNQELLLRNASSGKFEKPAFLPKDFEVLGFVDWSEKFDEILVRARLGKDGGSLVAIHPKKGNFDVLVSEDHFEYLSGRLDQKTGSLRYIAKSTEKAEISSPDPAIQADFDQIKKELGEEISFDSYDRSNQLWIVSIDSPVQPLKYYLYDRAHKKLEFLFYETDELSERSFAKMETISFSAQDGMKLYGYFTKPTYEIPGASGKPPLIVFVHGGPNARDGWHFSPSVQWLATRGYAVLQVNFRGSYGFGKAYHDAAKGEWGGKMTTDLIDGKNWVLSQGWADPTKVCIMGTSYGGYATLDALWRFPKDFVCGISNSGLSDLASMREQNPDYWITSQALEDQYLPDQGKSKESLDAHSALFHVDQIQAPLLLAHGTSDIRCKESQTSSIYAALKKLGKPVWYRKMPDRGHRFFDNIAYREEEFLARYLGGYFQPEDAYEVRRDDSE